VILETEHPVEGLDRISGVRGVRQTPSGYDIQISDMKAASEILNQASAQTVVYRFQVMEPTLNDIFIKTVGENRE
jgi:ABC-2 type transport system ATP-binding protein